jgi:hypothetical protein
LFLVFPLLLFFVFDTISYKSFSPFLFFYFYTNSQWLVFVDNRLKNFVSDLHLKKSQSIAIFLHSRILKNILNKKLLDHFFIFFHTFCFVIYTFCLVMTLICCGPKMDLMFILTCLIFQKKFKFMLKQIMLMIIMLVCMASYMTVGSGHANHAFRVNVHFLWLKYVSMSLYAISVLGLWLV